MHRLLLCVAVAVLLVAGACASGGPEGGATGASNSNPSAGTAPSGPDRGTAVWQGEGGKVMIDYGRPALKGRDLEKMIQPGQEWRMGSNAATTLSTDFDLKFGDKVVPKGKYVLKARPVSEQDWLLLVEGEDEAKVAEIPLTFQRADTPAERMTIDLAEKPGGGRFVLRWGTLALSTDFERA